MYIDNIHNLFELLEVLSPSSLAIAKLALALAKW